MDGRSAPFVTFLLAGVLAAPPAGAVETIRVSEKTWTNPGCAQTDSCDLKEVRFRARDYKVWIEGSYSYGTGFSAHYKTETHDSLEKYGFVQTIRGCVFDTYKHDDGARAYWGYIREFYGDKIVHRHPEWVFDSVDTDPFYNSYDDLPRHFAYQWNRVPGSIQRRTREFYGREKPPTPELYVLDYPGTAFAHTGGAGAKNLSMQFEMCLHKTADVPKERAPDDLPLAGALTCFRWDSSFIYNHRTKAYETWDRLHPACEGELEEDPGILQVPLMSRPSPEETLGLGGTAAALKKLEESGRLGEVFAPSSRH